MNRLKRIWLNMLQGVKQAWPFPPAASITGRQRRRRGLVNAGEAERLDRLRNPSKYLGK